MNRNDHFVGHHNRQQHYAAANQHHHHGHARAPLARKVSSSSSCDEPPPPPPPPDRSGSQEYRDRLTPLQSPATSAHSSPVGSPRLSPSSPPARAAPRLKPRVNPKQLIRRTSSGLRDELGSLIGELSLSSGPPPQSPGRIGQAADTFARAQAQAQANAQTSSQEGGTKAKTVTPENSMATDPPHTGTAHPPPSSAAEVAKREKFLLFVRILFKCLDTSPSVHPSLRVEAKRVVRECTAKNRAGVEGYSPLVDALECRLRELDGMGGHWERAEGYVRQYLIMRGRAIMKKKKQMMANAAGHVAKKGTQAGGARCHCAHREAPANATAASSAPISPGGRSIHPDGVQKEGGGGVGAGVPGAPPASPKN